MTEYEQKISVELKQWQRKITKDPSFADRLSKQVQDKMSGIIPEKVHQAVTFMVEKMFKLMLYGAEYLTGEMPDPQSTLLWREAYVKQTIKDYQKTAGVEGAVTGAGGILMGIADFPVLVGIKLKMLFEISRLYGYDVGDYRERLFMLYIFQLAFSSQHNRPQVYKILENWQAYADLLPKDPAAFDWRSFQQEYRDYIDLAKMAQLIPVVGAAVGAVANYKLIDKLGATAMQCYRMRKLDDGLKLENQ
ncbi:EcsC family protein [Pedobacter duraquae]|uniref:EcsC family protein n=1 Tax=Pedobacter duraquae TaxID=425511 RepID=A0A4R6IL84_9SPHI|nr:EcsC family protein [Pedobacter duraquae]TDO22843.1 EcsC family protein [Pedobacter duraquae]